MVKKKVINIKKMKKNAKKTKKSAKKVKTIKHVAVEPQYVSRLAFSKILGIAYSTLQHNIKNGNVQLTTRNGKDVINVKTEKQAYLNSRKGNYKTNLKIKDQDPQGVLFNTGQANLRTQIYKSKTAEMEYYQRLEHLVPVLRVNSTWENIARLLQKEIMAIPARIGPLMAGITDPHEATHTLQHELNLALKNIAEKGLKNEGTGDDGDPALSSGAA